MTQQEFFEHVLRELERLEIPYMVAGSIGAMIHSEPRLTTAMDVVVDLDGKRAEDLVAAFSGEGFYITPIDAIQAELGRRGMFNLLHMASGSKVDFIVRKNTAHAIEEFARRRLEPFTREFQCHAATPEDIMLVKLCYFREGGSEKHLRDVRSMLDVRCNSLDRAYLAGWIQRLGLEDEWSQAEAFDRN